MSLKLGSRKEWVAQSEIRNMTIECDRIHGINLAQGVCDLKLPDPVGQGAQQAIWDGINAYTRYDGLAELRQAIAQKQKWFAGMDVDPESEVIVSAGATGAFYCACLALLDPGDEMVVFEPYYGYHISTLMAAGVKPVYIRTHPPDWSFSKEDLQRVISSKTRGILINTPANPSGKVFSKEELQCIADIAVEQDIFVFTDEIYEHFVYDGRKHIAPATLDGMKHRTITISGLSKTFSITGWRIGYCICDAQWAQTIGHFNDLIYVCAPAPLQMGVARGLQSLGTDYYDDMTRLYQAKRDKICNALANAGFDPCVPEGAYYVLCDISRVPGNTGKEKAMNLLRKTGVACVPGQAFYHDPAGDHLARFCFAKEDQIIDQACSRIESAK